MKDSARRVPKLEKSPKPWRIVESQKVADARLVKMYRDKIVAKNGFETDHIRLLMRDFSVIVPVLDRDRLVFVWNYRHPLQGWELELPAGLIEKGESSHTSASRELKEETGYSAGSIKKLGWVYTLSGITSQRAHIFLANQLKKGKVHREPYEYMKMEIFTIKEAYKLLRSGNIVHAPTISALGLAEKLLLE